MKLKMKMKSSLRMLPLVERLFVRFRKDQVGNIAILAALTLPVLVGFAGLGTEGALWYYTHHQMQDAADSAAISAATAYSGSSGTNITTQADGVTALYGYTDGSGGTTVVVNRPPSQGRYTSRSGAVEVIVSQPQTRILSALWSSSSTVTITARAVALANAGVGCVLALNPHAAASASEQGSVAISLNSCSLYDNSDASNAVSVGGSAIYLMSTLKEVAPNFMPGVLRAGAGLTVLAETTALISAWVNSVQGAQPAQPNQPPQQTGPAQPPPHTPVLPPPPVVPPAPVTHLVPAVTHDVLAGESLSRILRNEADRGTIVVGPTYRELQVVIDEVARLNQIANPNLIHIGQNLIIVPAHQAPGPG